MKYFLIPLVGFMVGLNILVALAKVAFFDQIKISQEYLEQNDIVFIKRGSGGLGLSVCSQLCLYSDNCEMFSLGNVSHPGCFHTQQVFGPNSILGETEPNDTMAHMIFTQSPVPKKNLTIFHIAYTAGPAPDERIQVYSYNHPTATCKIPPPLPTYIHARHWVVAIHGTIAVIDGRENIYLLEAFNKWTHYAHIPGLTDYMNMVQFSGNRLWLFYEQLDYVSRNIIVESDGQIRPGPIPGTPTGLNRPCVFSVGGDRFFIGGGQLSGVSQTDAYIFSMRSNTLLHLPRMPVANQYSTGTKVISETRGEEYIVFAGSYTLIFNVASHSWSNGPNTPSDARGPKQGFMTLPDMKSVVVMTQGATPNWEYFAETKNYVKRPESTFDDAFGAIFYSRLCHE